MQCPMDGTRSDAFPAMPFHNIADEKISHSSPLQSAWEHSQRHCPRSITAGEFPLAACPSILLHVLSSCELDPKDLAALEASCTFFSKPARFAPDYELSLPELVALDMCQKRAIFKSMKPEEREQMKRRCGGSWKLVLRYILVGEKNYHRETSQVVAGLGHSIAVTTNGDVYSFGWNCSGQLGHGDYEDKFKPSLIRSLQGIRITQAAVGSRRTMLVSDTGRVYTLGNDSFGELDYVRIEPGSGIATPKLVESLAGVFVVQATIGGYFSAVLSREGRVYTFSWGRAERLGHKVDPNDVEPCTLSGPLENVVVAQIAAGNCYLLMLGYKPSGMSVYSIGCGLGGKLGHGCKTHRAFPQLIEHFEALNLKPMSIAAGPWHAAVLGEDGRVCTWGWGCNGCLGHGDDEEKVLPTVVEGLRGIKAVRVVAGEGTTFVIADNGDVYAFGSGACLNLGLEEEDDITDYLTPVLMTSLKVMNERVVQISPTNTSFSRARDNRVYPHTLVLMESGKLYAFGGGSKGQLGVKLTDWKERMQAFMRSGIDLW